MKCPFCKEEIERFTTECSACSEKIPKIYSYIDYLKEIIFKFHIFINNQNTKKVLKEVSIVAVILLIVGFIICNLLTLIKPPSCDSEFAKQEVLNAYKQESSIFKTYEINNIPEKYRADITFSESKNLNYDKKTKKYSCSAKITLSPQKNETKFIGAIQQGEEINSYYNSEYNKIQGLVYALLDSKTSCNTEYEIYKNKNKNEIKINVCNNSDFWGEEWKQSESWDWFALNENAQKVFEKVKIKKAISLFEDIAAVYMAENDVFNLYGLTENNCKKLKNFIMDRYIKSQHDCKITLIDGSYWQFNPSDGSVVVSEKKENPKYKVKMGVCNNGVINCSESYPNVFKILNDEI